MTTNPLWFHRSERFCTFHKRSLTTIWAGLLFSVLFPGNSRADDWPQWLGPERDGIWRETGILTAFPKNGPRVRWKTPVGPGYSGPAVAAGRVYITDRLLGDGTSNPRSGFSNRRLVHGKERVLCLDEKSGAVHWQHSYECEYRVDYPSGPRATPLVHGGKVYTVGTMGDLLCLDAENGKLLWSKNFPKDYEAGVPVWGFSSSPLLDGDRLICLVGGPGSVVVAFHKDTGVETWRALSAREPGYGPPMIYTLGGRRQLILWHPEAVNGLDPETGKVVWSVPFESRAGLTVPTPRALGDLLFVTAFYNGPLMLRAGAGQATPQILWRGKSRSEMPSRTDGLHAIMSTPILKDDHIYGVCSYGELRCLDARTGRRLWATHKPTSGVEARWGNAFLVENADRCFLFSEKGDLIIARLSPQGYEEISRVSILKPTNVMAGRPVVWSHPAFANRSIYARNDEEIVCVSLAADSDK